MPQAMKRPGLKRSTKRIPRVSKKKAKSQTAEKSRYMVAVKGLDCCICGQSGPSEAHHCRSDFMLRCDWQTIPLCIPCHKGPEGYHGSKKPWERRNGKDHEYVAQTQIEILGAER